MSNFVGKCVFLSKINQGTRKNDLLSTIDSGEKVILSRYAVFAIESNQIYSGSTRREVKKTVLIIELLKKANNTILTILR